MAAEAVRSAG